MKLSRYFGESTVRGRHVWMCTLLPLHYGPLAYWIIESCMRMCQVPLSSVPCHSAEVREPPSHVGGSCCLAGSIQRPAVYGSRVSQQSALCTVSHIIETSMHVFSCCPRTQGTNSRWVTSVCTSACRGPSRCRRPVTCTISNPP